MLWDFFANLLSFAFGSSVGFFCLWSYDFIDFGFYSSHLL